MQDNLQSNYDDIENDKLTENNCNSNNTETINIDITTDDYSQSDTFQKQETNTGDSIFYENSYSKSFTPKSKTFANDLNHQARSSPQNNSTQDHFESTEIEENDLLKMKQILNGYIYDFMVKNSLNISASAFSREADINENGNIPTYNNSTNNAVNNSNNIDDNIHNSNNTGYTTHNQNIKELYLPVFKPFHDTPNSSLFEWWDIFWDLFNIKSNKTGSQVVRDYYQILLQERTVSQNYYKNAFKIAVKQLLLEEGIHSSSESSSDLNSNVINNFSRNTNYLESFDSNNVLNWLQQFQSNSKTSQLFSNFSEQVITNDEIKENNGLDSSSNNNNNGNINKVHGYFNDSTNYNSSVQKSSPEMGPSPVSLQSSLNRKNGTFLTLNSTTPLHNIPEINESVYDSKYNLKASELEHTNSRFNFKPFPTSSNLNKTYKYPQNSYQFNENNSNGSTAFIENQASVNTSMAPIINHNNNVNGLAFNNIGNNISPQISTTDIGINNISIPHNYQQHVSKIWTHNNFVEKQAQVPNFPPNFGTSSNMNATNLTNNNDSTYLEGTGIKINMDKTMTKASSKAKIKSTKPRSKKAESKSSKKDGMDKATKKGKKTVKLPTKSKVYSTAKKEKATATKKKPAKSKLPAKKNAKNKSDKEKKGDTKKGSDTSAEQDYASKFKSLEKLNRVMSTSSAKVASLTERKRAKSDTVLSRKFVATKADAAKVDTTKSDSKGANAAIRRNIFVNTTSTNKNNNQNNNVILQEEMVRSTSMTTPTSLLKRFADLNPILEVNDSDSTITPVNGIPFNRISKLTDYSGQTYLSFSNHASTTMVSEPTHFNKLTTRAESSYSGEVLHPFEATHSGNKKILNNTQNTGEIMGTTELTKKNTLINGENQVENVINHVDNDSNSLNEFMDSFINGKDLSLWFSDNRDEKSKNTNSLEQEDPDNFTFDFP